jgi:predicted transcriptional regulator of viral defense system
MKLDLLQPFEQLPYFTIAGFRQLLRDDGNNDQRARELLSRWGQKGYVLPLKRGVYMTRRFYELHRGEPDFSPAVSAILQPQSYVSLEFVLQRAGVLTEATYPVTAVTTKNTRTIENELGTFVFRHIRVPLYDGFKQRIYHGMFYFIASSAKALFDYFYLRPLPRAFRNRHLDLAEELRLNLDSFVANEQAEFAGFVGRSASEKMHFILDNLRRTVWRP